jgi:predicted ATPase/DNA-binding CsgD family transcriptional regulator
VGREQEVAAVRRRLLVPGVRLLTLTGPGGVGKTRLALRAAAGLPDRFADGVWFVGLQGLADPRLVLPGIAQALGIEEGGGAALAPRVHAHLRDKTLLLVLDNCEHLLAAGPGVADLLAASPGLKVLATSREPLRLRAEHEQVVPPLTVPERGGPDSSTERVLRSEAARLLVQRAQAVRPDFRLSEGEAAAVAEICHRLDGLPLAIELAAARLRALSPRALANQLAADGRAPLRLLTGGPRDAPARQRTLWATIGWSYDLLSPRERALFRRLTVFAGGCTLEAAAGVAGDLGDPDAVLDGLLALVDKSLLQRDDRPDGAPRFRMLETVRAFALERLARAGEATAAGRAHAAALLALARRVRQDLDGPRLVPALDRLEAELNDIRAALTWFEAQPSAGDGLRLLGALTRFWHLRGHRLEALEWFRRLLGRSPDVPPAERAGILEGASLIAWHVGADEVAEAWVDEAVALCRRAPAPARLADLLGVQRMYAEVRRDAPRAAALSAERLTLLRRLQASGRPDEPGVRWALHEEHLERMVQAMGFGGPDPALARRHGEARLAIAREIGSPLQAARALINLTHIALQARDVERATRLAAEALGLCRQIGDTGRLAQTEALLATAALRRAEPVRAAGHLEHSLRRCRELGDQRGTGRALLGLAVVAARRRCWPQAAGLFGAAAAFPTTWPVEYDLLEPAPIEAEVRQRLGDEAYGRVWSEGWTAPLDRVAAMARALALPGRPAADERRSGADPPRRHGAARPALPDGLTPREGEVLRLVAAGRSNREIAADLVLSVRTVEKHMAAIYGKTGTHGRVAAAAYALRHPDLSPVGAG